MSTRETKSETTNFSKKRSTPKPVKTLRTGARAMRVGRFLTGMLITTVGVGLILTVAFGLLHGWIDSDFSLPLVGLCMVFGLMFLGGGFGVMATSSGTFDDDEFDRLMAGENPRRDAAHETQAVISDGRSQSPSIIKATSEESASNASLSV